MFGRIWKMGWEGFGFKWQVKSLGKRVLEGMEEAKLHGPFDH